VADATTACWKRTRGALVELKQGRGLARNTRTFIATALPCMATVLALCITKHHGCCHVVGGKSRGRGIQCFNNLQRILQYSSCPGELGGPSSSYVVQKYIEAPLIIRQRKFDIRQWVLVTSWAPLTVWFYQVGAAGLSPPHAPRFPCYRHTAHAAGWQDPARFANEPGLSAN
jgi:hypothetical protein